MRETGISSAILIFQQKPSSEGTALGANFSHNKMIVMRKQPAGLLWSFPRFFAFAKKLFRTCVSTKLTGVLKSQPKGSSHLSATVNLSLSRLTTPALPHRAGITVFK